MTKRIQELANQCWRPNDYGPSWFDYDKFAELIVTECVGLMMEKQAYYESPGTYEPQSHYDRCCAKVDAFGDAADTIKHHFRTKC